MLFESRIPRPISGLYSQTATFFVPLNKFRPRQYERENDRKQQITLGEQ